MSAAAVAFPYAEKFPEEEVFILDPSELYRPEHKKQEDFRVFSDDDMNPMQIRVRETYMKMHTYQTVEFVREKMKYWSRFDKARMTVLEGLEMLNRLVDESDPDVDIPNIVHAFQTAERIREAHPDKPWFQLTGLIHDLGKIMALYGEPQWCVVGDTFPVGCGIADSVVYKHTSFFDNDDIKNPMYNTRLGMYSENCGLENVLMSWGHDEYMYQVLLHNTCYLPEEALYIVRFHSFYPWHTGNDYNHLTNEKDKEMLKWVREFNKFDLYSKSHVVPDVEELKPYYQSLIDRYIPGVLEW